MREHPGGRHPSRRSASAHRLVRHAPVSSLAKAAAVRGMEPADVVKTLVVRRSEGDHVLVLVPGNRSLSWPKLRALLGVSRLSLPDAAAAKAATGYERGTITLFGATTAWPVVADERLRGRTGKPGCGGVGRGGAPRRRRGAGALDAQVADVTDPEA